MEDITRKYSNGEVTIVWKPALCIHAGNCFRELPSVFDPLERPWINPDGATTEKIIETVNHCPTRALTYEMDQPSGPVKAEEPPPALTEISLLPDGPLMVTGRFWVTDCYGKVIETDDMAVLCRCGASKAKPFCDGSHRGTGFRG